MNELVEAASWSLEHFYRADQANAAIHCAPVKFSPVTFRLAEAILAAAPANAIAAEVCSHIGQYSEDPGR